MSSDTPVQVGQILAGKYRVDRVLGQGGMGVVVAATHEQLDQKVAVKFLLPEAAKHAQATTRFLREARAAVKIQSEFVARVTDVGTLPETGTPYMVMEYLDGSDLEGVVEKQGPLPVEEAVEYVMHACAALAEAHSHGIIHRDLKPANLFRTIRSDGTPVVKVLDFGISKMTLGVDSMEGANLTGTAAVLGTPMYMSPEQIRSTRDVDARTDIWSLGSILQELLTGTQPFPADSMPQLFAAIIEAQPTPISQFRSDVPVGLQNVVLRCLAKTPDGRYPSVAELAADLVPYAPARAANLAERSSRVLGKAGSMLPSPASLIGAPSGPRTALGPGTPASASAKTALGVGQTAAAWGTTQSGGSNRTVVVATSIVAAVLGIGGLVTALLMRDGDAAPTAEPGTNAPLPTQSAPVTPPEPVVVAPAPPVPSIAPILQPEAEPAPVSPPSAPEAAVTPKAATAKAPRATAPAPAPAKKTSSAPPSTHTPAKTNPLDIELK